jgi:8-oxo-dGTP diphosphatase
MSTVNPPPAHPREPAHQHPRVGVGVLVFDAAGRVLLGLRRGAHGAGTWSAPGGHLEWGESFEDCARREVAEETGLMLDELQAGPVTNDVFAAEGRHYATVVMLARHPGGTPQRLEPDKCERWDWFDWQALPEPLFAPLASLRAMGWRPPPSQPLSPPASSPLYDAAVPVFLHYLERLDHLVDRVAQACASGPDPAAAEAGWLAARLAPDMLPWATQVEIAANFALRGCCPLVGRPVPPGETPQGLAALRERIARVRAQVAALSPSDFIGAESRRVRSQAGDAELDLPAGEFLQRHLLPNFFFHLTMVYAIARQGGLALGKPDFDGQHAYPPPGTPWSPNRSPT